MLSATLNGLQSRREARCGTRRRPLRRRLAAALSVPLAAVIDLAAAGGRELVLAPEITGGRKRTDSAKGDPRMPTLPVLAEENASPAVNALYSDFRQRMGFPSAPNFIRVQGHSPTTAAGTWGVVQNVLVKGALPRALKEMMFVAISKDRDCKYCEAAHTACCRMLGVDAMTIEYAGSAIDQLEPARTRDVIRFAVKCARTPQELSPEDFAVLRGHGLTTSEIVEVVGMSALAVYANIIADATGVENDNMFDQF
jgi:uncharacterized peroxidase-related enzyme